MLDTVVSRISAFEGTVESPGTTMQIAVYLHYWTIIVLLAFAQAVAMIVIAFGIIATAVCVLLGPVFIPFFIVPQLDWLFWGWFKCFIQYSFYQVVAAAVIFIIGNILTSFLTLYNGQPITIDQQGALITPLIIVAVSSIYVLLKVPALTSHIFSGSAGLGSGGLAGEGLQMSNHAAPNEAKQLYMEQFGEAIVTNSYLKIAVAVLSLVILGLVFLDVRTLNTFHDFKPLVIRIDELGRAQAVGYDTFAYKPEDKEAKYFLTQFCELYYRRNRYTVNDDFTKSFYFLDGKLANDIMAAYKNEKVIENFLSNPSSPEVDIDVQQVALEPMLKPPYKASVDFYMIQYSPVDHSVLKKTLYTATFVFMFRTNVPSQLIPINPLGLTITYFREDEAFK